MLLKALVEFSLRLRKLYYYGLVKDWFTVLIVLEF